MSFPSSAISRTELSIGLAEFPLEASRRGFIAPSVAPPVRVAKQAASYGKITVEELLRKTTPPIRTAGAGYQRDTMVFTTGSYSCVEHGVEEILDDQALAAYSDVVDGETHAAARLLDRICRPFEKLVADMAFDTGVFTGDLTNAPSVPWDVPANATPVADVQAAAVAVFDRTGIWPDSLAVSKRTFFALSRTDEMLEKIVAGGAPANPAVVSAQAAGSILGLRQVLVGSGGRNDAAEGQNADIVPIWADGSALLFKAAESGDLSEPCAFRSFFWTGDSETDASDRKIIFVTEEYREESKRGSVLRGRANWDLDTILPNLGHLLTGLLTVEG